MSESETWTKTEVHTRRRKILRREGTLTGVRARNMENKKQSGIE